VLFCAIFLAIMSFTIPIIAAFWWSELTWQNAAVGVVGLAGAVWLFYALKAPDFTAIVYGFAVLMVFLNLAVQRLVLPPVNSVQIWPFAERIGAIIKPGHQVGVYRDRPHHYFNFYSRIRRFEYLGAGPEQVVKFLSGSGPRFILVKKDSLNELKETWRGDLNVVAEQPTVGSRRWFRQSGVWLLLYACNEGCGS
jgi:hypothetical protein